MFPFVEENIFPLYYLLQSAVCRDLNPNVDDLGFLIPESFSSSIMEQPLGFCVEDLNLNRDASCSKVPPLILGHVSHWAAVFSKHFPAGRFWHGKHSVMLRQYERSSGTAGGVDRWPLHLRHTKRSPRRKHESSFRQMFLPASLQNAAITLFVFRALTIMLQCGEIMVYPHDGQQGLRGLGDVYSSEPR